MRRAQLLAREPDEELAHVAGRPGEMPMMTSATTGRIASHRATRPATEVSDSFSAPIAVSTSNGTFFLRPEAEGRLKPPSEPGAVASATSEQIAVQ